MRKFILFFQFISFYSLAQTQTWIRINQLGYLETSIKVAVLVSKQENLMVKQFEICDALTNQVVFKSNKLKAFGKYAAFKTTFRLNFSEFKQKGAYYVRVGEVKSPSFRIANDVYEGTADFILKYMRQQRSNYNPFLKDTCHKTDGFIVYHPDKQKDSTYLDVSGGWHDASDYLQYLPTSANATFQLLFAYQQNPESFGDAHDAWGNKGKNGIPDVLDEAKWGLDWLCKMNPKKGEYYNQIADDRDHIGMRLPNKDTSKYAPNKGLMRPVYFITGKPQGALKYKNRTLGVASSAGKFSSAFALGSVILSKYYPDIYSDSDRQYIKKSLSEVTSITNYKNFLDIWKSCDFKSSQVDENLLEPDYLFRQVFDRDAVQKSLDLNTDHPEIRCLFVDIHHLDIVNIHRFLLVDIIIPNTVDHYYRSSCLDFYRPFQ